MNERTSEGSNEGERESVGRHAKDREEPWDPNEQVGDIYQVDIGPEGIESIERLAAPGPQVWVGSLGDYNNGILHGEWLDAAKEPADLHADIYAMLARSPTMADSGDPAEEWAIFDHEGFGMATIHEHDSVETVSRIARGIAEHGLAFAAWASVMEGVEEAWDRFEENYLGHYESTEAYAKAQLDEAGCDELLDQVVPKSLRPYVQLDVAGMARDMELSGDVHALPAEEGGIWLFDGRS